MTEDEDLPEEAAKPLPDEVTLTELLARSGELDARIDEHLRLLEGR